MLQLWKVLSEAVKVRLDAFAADTAEAIQAGDKLRLLKNAIVFPLTLLGLIMGGATAVGLAYLGKKILLLIIGVPAAAVLFMKSYFANRQEHVSSHIIQEKRVLLEERAEALYEFVRDGIFLVLRAVSDHTPIIRPASPSSIETSARICYRDGVAIFQFNALLSEDIKNIRQLRRTLDRALGQMLRNGEIPGLPSRLVTIEGRSYMPIQILGLTDLGSSVNIDVVFVNEKSVPMLDRQQLLWLEDKKKEAVPYDTEF